jgi:hypothetical protein
MKFAYITYHEDKFDEGKSHIRQKFGNRKMKEFATLNMMQVELTDDEFAQLQQDPNVKHISTTEGVKNVKFFDHYSSEAVYPEIGLSHRLHRATGAWASGYDGTGITIGVIDGNMRLLPIDNSANFSLVLMNPVDPAPITVFPHGAVVVNTINAPRDGVHGAGFAPNSQVFGYDIADANGDLDQNAIISALDTAHQQGCKIVNMSFGIMLDPTDPFVTTLQNAIDTYAAQGMIFVAAAGNDSIDLDEPAPYKVYPAQCNNVVCVGAVDSSTKQAAYSNYGVNTIDIWASGMVIEGQKSPDQQIAIYDIGLGTSFAAPTVTAILALLWQANPSMTASQIINLAKSTAIAGLDGCKIIQAPINYTPILTSIGYNETNSYYSTMDPSKPIAPDNSPIAGPTFYIYLKDQNDSIINGGVINQIDFYASVEGRIIDTQTNIPINTLVQEVKVSESASWTVNKPNTIVHANVQASLGGVNLTDTTGQTIAIDARLNPNLINNSGVYYDITSEDGRQFAVTFLTPDPSNQLNEDMFVRITGIRFDDDLAPKEGIYLSFPSSKTQIAGQRITIPDGWWTNPWNGMVYLASGNVLLKGMQNYSDGKKYYLLDNTAFISPDGPFATRKDADEDWGFGCGWKVANRWITASSDSTINYRTGSDGAVLTGWQYYNSGWYYFSPSDQSIGGRSWLKGQMIHDVWLQDGGYWYYFGSDGHMKKGWFQLGTKWYYAAPTTGTYYGNQYYLQGACLLNEWLYDSGYWYYLKSDKSMAVSETLTIGNKAYNFDSHGHCLNP